MKDANEFKWTILGTSNGEPPASPLNPGRIEMKLYDSGYTYDELRAAARKDKRMDKYFRDHCHEIFAGKDRSWNLWMVVIYENRITFDYCRQDGNAACCLVIERPKILGLRFLVERSFGGATIQQETTCLIYGNQETHTCRTQIEEFENGGMIHSISVYSNGKRRWS